MRRFCWLLIMAPGCRVKDTGDSGGDSGATGITWSLSGTATDFNFGTAAPEGTCIAAHALAGPLTDPYGSTTVQGEEGAFTIPGLTETPDDGMLLVLTACDSGAQLATTATRVGSARYLSVQDGDVVEDAVAWGLSAGFVAGMEQDLSDLGASSGGLVESGSLLGAALDADGLPLVGATVTGGDAWYLDVEPEDGGFFASETGGTNPATQPDASGLFLVPGAAGGAFTVQAEGLTFPTLQVGSVEGAILFAPIEPETE
ncbi:MAG: hypothetical protein H6742_16945 [Alphaproteobacteria bacterium]|nr:hypothetical protein [Alphaproteobacteria bacterium]